MIDLQHDLKPNDIFWHFWWGFVNLIGYSQISKSNLYATVYTTSMYPRYEALPAIPLGMQLDWQNIMQDVTRF